MAGKGRDLPRVVFAVAAFLAVLIFDYSKKSLYFLPSGHGNESYNLIGS